MSNRDSLVEVRSPFNYDVKVASNRAALACRDPSRTNQAQREEADINYIVKQFGITGQLPVGVRMPTYGDFDTVSDYQTALEAIREADAAFLKLPADVRSRFQNDPALFVDFCSDPANLEEARKLGLAPALPGVETTPAAQLPAT